MPDAVYEITLPGTPPSFNDVGHTGNRWNWSRAKRLWDGYFTVALLEAKVPKGKLSFVSASATLFFTTNRKRDVGNYRTILEKCCGDALQLGWLDDDDPEHYEFGAVTFEKIAKGKPPKTIVRLEVTK